MGCLGELSADLVMTKTEEELAFWMIMAWDRDGALPARLARYDEHRAYLNASTIEILAAGPAVADDGETPTGSFFVVRSSKAEAQEFNDGDPFNVNGVWGDITISRFLYRRGKIEL